MATTNQPKLTGSDMDSPPTPSNNQGLPPVMNLGKVKNKIAKKLKKGRGGLMGEITQTSNLLQANAEGSNHQLIISYEQKPGKTKKKKKINFMGIKINRKKLKKRMKKSGIGTSFL